mgnify:FL=1
MGIFNLFGTKTTHEDDVLVVTYLLMWGIANSDEEFHEKEDQWIREWIAEHPQSKMKKLHKRLETLKLDAEQMQGILNRCSWDEKAAILAECVELIMIDGVMTPTEADGLRALAATINADIGKIREIILKHHNVDIDKISKNTNQVKTNPNPNNPDRNTIQGFRQGSEGDN